MTPCLSDNETAALTPLTHLEFDYQNYTTIFLFTSWILNPQIMLKPYLLDRSFGKSTNTFCL